MRTRRYLTIEQKQQIGVRHAAGETLGDLAGAFDCDYKTIHGALRFAGVSVRYKQRKHPRFPFNEGAFETLDSEEARYFIGLLLADGNIYLSRRGTHCVQLKLSGEDGAMVERFRRFIGSDHALRITPGCGAQAQKTGIGVHSDRLAQSLMRWGILPRKSLIAELPPELADDRHVWRGYVDGDGYIAVRRSGGRYPYDYALLDLYGSIATLDQFRAFVLRRWPECGVSVRPSGKIAFFRLKCRQARVILRELYDGCTIALPRKLAVAQAAIATGD